MFEVGMQELGLIFLVALIVLGPQRLPKLVSQVGRWVGKARHMARQFHDQLESEIHLEELAKARAKEATPATAPVAPVAPPELATMTGNVAVEPVAEAPVAAPPATPPPSQEPDPWSQPSSLASTPAAAEAPAPAPGYTETHDRAV